MITAHQIDPNQPEQLNALAGLYEQFRMEAIPRYGWAHEPVDFETFKSAIASKMIRGLWVTDSAKPYPIALMLYCLEEHRAIEINVIFIIDEAKSEQKTITDRLMRLFIKSLREDPATTQGIDVVSYAMLGEQGPLIRTLLWYGFKPVGQAIVQFPIMDPISIQILKQQVYEPLPPSYRIAHWEPQMAGDVSNVVYEAFSKATDSLWDPRFRTALGGRRVVGMITQSMMGTHLPSCTSVLLKDDKAVGFCFVIQTSMTEGNIPLIAVSPTEKHKGLGNRLLKHSLDAVVEQILAGKLGMLSVSATLDTDNIAAIKMYRRMGFREESNYPHIYLPKDSLMTMAVGKWC